MQNVVDSLKSVNSSTKLKTQHTRKSSAGKVRSALYLLIFIALNTFINVAVARDYKVEVLVFENNSEHQITESNVYADIQEMSSNADIWLIEPSMLLDQASAIKNSEDYRLLHHYSWGQESLPISQAAAVNVNEAALSGWIKVYANQLLFINVDLDYDGYRMVEKRRVKLNEKHFFDHPKFGIVMQISRLEPPKKDQQEADFPESP